MIRLFTSKGWHKATLHLARCGSRIPVALALAFITTMGVNPVSFVQAAPANAPYQFNLVVVPSALYACENESMTFKVSIEVQLQNLPGDTNGRFRRVQGNTINAEVVAGAKSITPSRNFIGNPGALDPYSVTFTFNAGAAQTTHLRFSTEISTFWFNNSPVIENGINQRVTKAIDIEIRKCSYKVEMLFMEPMFGMGLLTGTAHEIRLEQITDTQFNGGTDLNFSYNFIRGLGCPMKAKVDSVILDYSADLAGETLYINFSFPSLKVTSSITDCGDKPTTSIQTSETPPGAGTVSVPSKGGLGVLSTPYWTYMFIVTKVSE